MKIRTSFVSNSSSSSFILIFDEFPKSIEELIQVLDFSSASKSFTSQEYAKEIFDDICEGPDADDEELKSLFEELVYFEPEVQNAYKMLNTEAAKVLIDKFADQKLQDFRKNNHNKRIRVVGYSDNDGEFYSNLEHADLFNKINHIYVNQH